VNLPQLLLLLLLHQQESLTADPELEPPVFLPGAAGLSGVP
jgi:hypothetical protein